LAPGDRKQIQFTTWDTKKNTSTLQFELIVEQGQIPKTIGTKTPFFDTKQYYFPEEAIYLSAHGFTVKMSECSLYEPLKKSEIDLQKKRFGNPDTPVEQAFRVEIEAGPSSLAPEKHYIQVLTGGGKRKVLKTNYSDGKFGAESNFMRTFSLQVETIAPTIIPLNFDAAQTIVSKQQLNWKITEKETDLADYDLYIDGEWQLLEYEYKGSYLIFKLRKPLKGQKELKIILKDNANNTSVWSRTLNFQ
jgi:hypothetical protein